MMVGVHNIRENEPLTLLEKQMSLHNEVLFTAIVDNNQKPRKTSETVHDVVCGCMYLNILHIPQLAWSIRLSDYIFSLYLERLLK